MIKCFLELNIISKKNNNTNCEYDKDYKKIKLLNDDSILLKKMIYFPTITVIIRCIFGKGGKYYPQVYLDDCLYQI